MKLLMLKGLPGSGKSTWARQAVSGKSDWIRVNKDSIREMMGNYKQKKEGLVLRTRDSLIELYLGQNLNVIVDDTNLHPKHEARLRELAGWFKAEFEIQDFTGVPLKECIENDLKRPISVGERVIKRMWREFLAPKLEVQRWTIGLPKAIIVDIDGTVALHVARGPYDIEQCRTDKPNTPIVSMVNHFAELGYKVLFVSGREEKYRDLTVAWFQDHKINGHELFMRPTDDKREDSIVKQEIYDSRIRGNYNVFAVFDDRNRVVDMWRRNGLTCLQVADGDF